MLDLHSTSLEELASFLAKAGFPRFRAKQIYQWVQQKGVTSFAEMRNLPKDLQAYLAEHAFLTVPEILTEKHAAQEDTIKFLLRWADGNTTELVLMLYHRKESKERRTCCISTQVGCGMACGFCATALGGLIRNLSPGEIVAQVQTAQRWCVEHGLPGVTNVVYMGMGEPFANTQAVLKSIALLNDPQGIGLGQRHITISTCGLIPGIQALAATGWSVGLAVSLHSAFDQVRNTMMPVNQRYPIAELLAACQQYVEQTGRRVTFEYALFDGVNDQEVDAHALGKLLQGGLYHVNVIPGNPVAETIYRASPPEQRTLFCHIVSSYGVAVTLREAKGLDIDGACGQLRRRYLSS